MKILVRHFFALSLGCVAFAASLERVSAVSLAAEASQPSPVPSPFASPVQSPVPSPIVSPVPSPVPSLIVSPVPSAEVSSVPSPVPSPEVSSVPSPEASPAATQGLPPLPEGVEIKFFRQAVEGSSDSAILGLEWDQSAARLELQLSADSANPEKQVVAVLKGRFKQEDWTLRFGDRTVATGKDGAFRIRTVLREPVQTFPVLAVSPKGIALRENLVIAVTGWSKLNLGGSETKAGVGGVAISAGVSMTLINYQESGLQGFSETAITAKIAFQRPWAEGSRFDLGLNAYGTLIPLTSTEAGHAKIQFLGLNARAGYRFSGIPAPWVLSLMGGLYFTTTSTTNNTFGFQNLMGPQIFPLLRRVFANGDSAAGYIKFSPVGAGFSLNVANREFAGGLSWTRPFSQAHPGTLSLDIAQLKATIEGIEFRSTNVSLGVGVGF